MKKIVIAVLMTFIMLGCSNKSVQKLAILDSVVSLHVKVMSADGQLMNNKLKLDTLLKEGNSSAKDTVRQLIAKLALADSTMDIWMNKFEPEQKGKSDEEAITYLHSQKKQITAIDSQINEAVDQSNKFLKNIKGK